jgi:hypothetical protein
MNDAFAGRNLIQWIGSEKPPLIKKMTMNMLENDQLISDGMPLAAPPSNRVLAPP